MYGFINLSGLIDKVIIALLRYFQLAQFFRQIILAMSQILLQATKMGL